MVAVISKAFTIGMALESMVFKLSAMREAAVPVRHLCDRQLPLPLDRDVQHPVLPLSKFLWTYYLQFDQLRAGVRGSLVPFLVMPTYQIGKIHLLRPGRMRKVKKARAAACSAGSPRWSPGSC